MVNMVHTVWLLLFSCIQLIPVQYDSPSSLGFTQDKKVSRILVLFAQALATNHTTDAYTHAQDVAWKLMFIEVTS